MNWTKNFLICNGKCKLLMQNDFVDVVHTCLCSIKLDDMELMICPSICRLFVMLHAQWDASLELLNLPCV